MKLLQYTILLLILIAPISNFNTVHAAAPGDLITCSTTSSVYYVASDGTRWVFPNSATYFTWYSDFDDVLDIPCDELATHRIGKLVPYQAGTRLIKIQSIPKVYFVGPGGSLHWIQTEDQAINLFGSDWATRVDDVPDGFWSSYSAGTDLEDAGFPYGYIAKDQFDTHYIIESNVLRSIPVAEITDIQKTFATLKEIPIFGTTTGASFNTTDIQKREKLDRSPIFLLTDVDTGPTPPVLSINKTNIIIGDEYIVSWTSLAGATEYQLQEDNSSKFSGPSLVLKNEELKYTITQPAPANDFHYRVRAIINNELTSWSNTVSVNTDRYAMIEGVADTNQPSSNILKYSDPTNFSAPIATAMILDYYQNTLNDTYAQNLLINNSITNTADYLGYFFNTNDLGIVERVEDDPFGTRNKDISLGLIDYLLWDGTSTTTYDFISPIVDVTNKSSYNNWSFKTFGGGTGTTTLFNEVKKAVIANKPMLASFTHWNPETSTETLEDIRMYTWGETVSTSADTSASRLPGNMPDEQWSLNSDNLALSHTAVIVGYIPDHKLNDDSDPVDWIIVRDNWATTPFLNMAIPIDSINQLITLTPQVNE